MGNDALLYERKGPVAWLTLNRPDALNALNTGIAAAFEKHLHFFSFAPLELRDHAGHRFALELGFRRFPATY